MLDIYPGGQTTRKKITYLSKINMAFFAGMGIKHIFESLLEGFRLATVY